MDVKIYKIMKLNISLCWIPFSAKLTETLKQKWILEFNYSFEVYSKLLLKKKEKKNERNFF